MKNQAELLSSKPYTLRLVLLGLPKSANKMLGAHRFVKHNNAVKWKRLIALTVGYLKPGKPLERFRLSMARHNSNSLDFDGLVLSFKPVVDGLVECGVLQNDNYSRTGPWKVEQFFRARKDGSCIEILVEEVEP